MRLSFIIICNRLTARAVKGNPALSFSSGSIIPNLTANDRSESSIIGYGNSDFVSNAEYACMSAIQALCVLTSLHESAIILTPRFVNSGANFAALPNSVVQTGVKSAGWLNKMHHLK